MALEPEETESSENAGNTYMTYANDEEIDPNVVQAAEAIMDHVGKTGDLIEPVALYNLNDELEAICFKISTGGFTSVNVNNYHVFDFCAEGNSEAHDYLNTLKGRSMPKFYTNGPLLTYYDEGNGKIVDIRTEEEFDKQDFVATAEVYAEEAAEYEVSTYATAAYPSHTFGTNTQAWTNYQPNGNHYMCVPAAFGIFLEYYQRVLIPTMASGTYISVQTGYNARGDICWKLTQTMTGANRPYVLNAAAGQNWNEICNGGDTYDTNGSFVDHNYGVNQFMKDYSNITQKFYQASYNWNDMVARLKINSLLFCW